MGPRRGASAAGQDDHRSGHGDIYITELESRVIDSPPMQRLRRVCQLGTTHLVYPGASHSRFSHALGTLRAAQDLLDSVVDSGLGPRAANDLFSQWRRRGADVYDEKIAEATRQQAKREGAELVFKGRDGRIQRRDSHGADDPNKAGVAVAVRAC